MKKIRRLVAERANYCCEYCLTPAWFCPDPFSVEHILSKAKGGDDMLDNLALSCQGCNNRKYTFSNAIDPITGQVVLIYHPRNDDWSLHFKWNIDFSKIIGISPTGRATVERMGLNRKELVNLRKVLASANEHPFRKI